GSCKITDLWVYVNGQFQGAYPTGNLIPIISNNEPVRINIFGGIKNNGISNTRLSYIFYDFITIDTLVGDHLTINRPLTFHYNPNTKFEWVEGFDGNGVSLIKSSNSDTTWKPALPIDCFEGNSAEMGLGAGASKIMVESSAPLTIPLNNPNVYLELNYKSNQVFEVGILNGGIQKPALFVNASDTWNKIYISMAETVNQAPYNTTQKVYIKMSRKADNQNPKMFLDNIKLVHF
ncbi:MAG: hypothetical protein ABIP51_06005, partial [Bacteroidia bacterium]